jgi:hypothetical protein
MPLDDDTFIQALLARGSNNPDRNLDPGSI